MMFDVYELAADIEADFRSREVCGVVYGLPYANGEQCGQIADYLLMTMPDCRVYGYEDGDDGALKVFITNTSQDQEAA